MTAILIDEYQGELFIFADGKVTRGDHVASETVDKVFELDSDTLWASCGDLRADENFKQLYELIESENIELDSDGAKHLEFDGTLYLVNREEITVIISVELENKDELNKSGIYKLSRGALPITDGSGGESLIAAYLMAEPRKASSRSAYIRRVRKCFDVGCSRVSSVGKMYSYKSLKPKIQVRGNHYD